MALNALDTVDELEGTGTNTLGCLKVPKGMDVYYPKAEGDVTFIILPYTITETTQKNVKPGDQRWCRPYNRYRGLGPNKKGFCIDNKLTFGERCAITEALAHYSGDPAKKPKSQRMCLINVYFPGTNEVKLMDFSFANFAEVFIEQMKKVAARPNKGWVAYFADPVEGSAITFSWKQETMPNGNKFFVATAIEFDKHDGVPAEVLAKAADLDKCLNRLSFAEVSSMFLGEDAEDDAIDAQDEIPEATKPAEQPKVEKPAKAEKPAPEPETKAVPKKVKPGEGSPAPKKEKANTWSKGANCYYEGKKCVVKKVDGDVISIAELADDDERYKVSADDISPFETEAPKTKAKKTEEPAVEPSKHEDAFDAEGWDD